MGNLNSKGESIEALENGALTYAAYKEFTYTGKEQNLTLDYINTDLDFPEGNYNSEILINGEVVSTLNFNLK